MSLHAIVNELATYSAFQDRSALPGIVVNGTVIQQHVAEGLVIVATN
jgi:hypothetical protein